MIVFEYAGSAANSSEFFSPEMPEETPAEEQIEEIVLPEYRFEPLIARPEDEAFQALPGEELEEIPTNESRGLEMMDRADRTPHLEVVFHFGREVAERLESDR